MTMVADPHTTYKVIGESQARPKLFGMGTITVAAFIGSPLAAFALVSANMRAKGDIRGEKVALGAGFLMVVICCVLAFHLTASLATIWGAGAAAAAALSWISHRKIVSRHTEFDGQCHMPVYGLAIAVLMGALVAGSMAYGLSVL